MFEVYVDPETKSNISPVPKTQAGNETETEGEPEIEIEHDTF